MSQMILPPTEPQPETPAPSTTTALIPQPPAPEPERPKYVYEYVPPKQPWVWRAVKWPVRKFFKGLILTGSAAKRHKIVTLVILALLIGAVGATYGVYRATHPPTPPSAAGGPSAGETGGSVVPETPFTISSTAQPPLPSGVINALHGLKTHDGHEFWTSLAPQFQELLTQNGQDETFFKQALTREQTDGIQYQQFIDVGGYVSLDGTSYYIFQIVFQQGNQSAQATLYFTANANGQIMLFQFLPRSPLG